MVDFLTINEVTLSKVEAVSGIEETLAAANDAAKRPRRARKNPRGAVPRAGWANAA